MEGFKEFQGKDLDAAIREACDYYDTSREKLEIEIVQDSKSGIFGIVGARKAKIQARRAMLREAVEDILGRREPRERGMTLEREEKKTPSRPAKAPCVASSSPASEGKAATPPASRGGAKKVSCNAPAAEGVTAGKSSAASPAENKSATPKSRSRAEKPHSDAARQHSSGRNGMEAKKEVARKTEMPPVDAENTFGEHQDEILVQDGFTVVPLAELDTEKLRAVSLEVVSRLVHPVVGEQELQVEFTENRVNVSIDCGDDSGLLIGREGQTLAALQYLASRMVSRGMEAAVRVHLDVGAYRRRQEEKLCEMALALAERVRTTGRSFSTRPLSSYHRRIVHLALQDMTDLQTRSSGEGALKRVVIVRHRG